MSPASPPAESFLRSGKVRDLYAVGADRLLLVASDRLSAFDVVLPTEIPDKGRVLTGLSRFWFERTADIVPNHLLGTRPDDLPAGVVPSAEAADELRGRMMLCRRVDVLPIEVIVRGYLAGSGWKDYTRSGAVCGIPLPTGLRESDRLPEPLFTPSTKAEQGAHDENIGLDEAAALIGAEMAGRVRDAAIELYTVGSAVAEPAGIILADTKFEFGIDRSTGELLLIDEVLTPDSSRFWDAATYEPGRAQASFDKQFVRDWLETQAWDKTAPGPELPAEIVHGTRQRYVEAFERITGASFGRYLAEDTIGSADAVGR
jgi:phosphoribosylaminoimidazole-succinocarboxamide synthase